jgi:hypothetical protein
LRTKTSKSPHGRLKTDSMIRMQFSAAQIYITRCSYNAEIVSSQFSVLVDRPNERMRLADPDR